MCFFLIIAQHVVTVVREKYENHIENNDLFAGRVLFALVKLHTL